MSLGSLISALFGGSQQAPAIQPQGSDPAPVNPMGTPSTASPYAMDSDGYIVPKGPDGQPGIQPIAQPPAVNNPEDVTVSAVKPDHWHKREPTFLGALADGYLMAHHMQPMYEQERDKRNMEEATAGFDQNPMQAIRRVQQIDPEMAWKMYNTQVDNQRQAGQLERQNRWQDLYNENLVYQRAAGAMRTANADTWGGIRDQMLKMGKARGVDLSGIIPDKYDPNAWAGIVYGAYPVPKQAEDEERHLNHQTQHQDRMSGQAIAAERNKVMAQQGEARIGIAKTNSETARMNANTAQQNANRNGSTKGSGISGTVQTSAGLRPYETAPDGNSMTVYDTDGTPHRYLKAGRLPNGKINWVPTKQAPSK